MRFDRFCLIAATAALVCACASVEDRGPQGMLAPGDPARAVMASVETVVTTDPAVDADDPALWADPSDPARAVMFGTDKSDGLYVYNLDGTVRQFLPSGPVNNVDFRQGFPTPAGERVLVAASNDAPGANGVNLYLFDPSTLTTADYGFMPTSYEPYGFCMGQRGETFFLVVTTKVGTVSSVRLRSTGRPVTMTSSSAVVGASWAVWASTGWANRSGAAAAPTRRASFIEGIPDGPVDPRSPTLRRC